MVVVLYLAETFAGNSEVVGQIVVSRRDDQFARAVCEGTTEAIQSVDGKVAVRAYDLLDPFVLMDVEVVVFGNLAVVLEGLVAIGLLVGAGEGHVADLEELRRGEERHISRVVEERVAEAALVHQKRCKAGALRLDSARKTRWSCTDYE